MENCFILNCMSLQLQEEEEPLDLSWPKEWRKRLNYILVAPIIFPLWIFLPDVRRPVSLLQLVNS